MAKRRFARAVSGFQGPGARCRAGGVGIGVQPLPAPLELIDVERQAALLNAELV